MNPTLLVSSFASTRRARGLAITLAACLSWTACSPKQDPADPDECPDVNYNLTTLKDAQFVSTIAAIDTEVTTRMAGKFPGCAVGIVAGGQIVYLKGYGVADRNVAASLLDDVPCTKSTVFGIGSVSKVLTSVAVMRLAELGLVNLDGPISAYFPYAVPAGWPLVTVRQLLAHRGGFARDPDATLASSLTPAQIDLSFGLAHASQHPRFAIWEFLLTTRGAPVVANIGTYAYSNIGYVILGAIVDQITSDAAFPGGPLGYERFVWKLFASDAHDAAITVALDHPWRAGDILGLAQSYDAAWSELNTNYSGWQSACGGWSMTIGDLSRVLLAIGGNQILSAASLTQMRTNPGPGIGSDNYGLGLFLEPKAGRVAWSHGGVIDGFRAQVIYWPGENVGVAVLANAGVQGVHGIAEEVGRLWIEGDHHVAPPDQGQQAAMQTARFQVSRDHFARAEAVVRPLLRSLGERGTADWLTRAVSSQSSLGRSLVERVQFAPSDIEGSSRLFLDVLRRDGHVASYTR